MRWKTLAGVGMLLALVPSALAKSYTLRETVKPGDCFRIQLDMTLKGEMRFTREGKKRTLPLTATATHRFPERVLSVNKDGAVEKSARFYETAKASIKTGRETSERILRDERRLFIVQCQTDQLLAYSPSGALFRNELELCSEHIDTLNLPGLLTGKSVSLGDTWKISNSVAQLLCHFEGLTEHKLTGKLEEVNGTKAIVSVKGTANGIDLGALVNTTIDARCEFDLNTNRLIKVEWKQKDEREQGPASPAMEVELTTTITRTLIKHPEELSDSALAHVPDGLSVPPQMLQLDYQHPKRIYGLLCTRDWQIVSETDEHLVMRLMDRGDFVAQVTVTPWTKAAPGKHLTPEEFHEAMARTPGWDVEKDLQAGPVATQNERWVYRLVQLGKLDGMDVMQAFYLIVHDDGRQVVMAFVMTPKQADRLGTRDLSLAGSLDFPK
jgi:hypothetical protein